MRNIVVEEPGRNSARGVSLIEVLFATVILIIVSLSIMGVVATAIAMNHSNKVGSTGTMLGQSVVEQIKATIIGSGSSSLTDCAGAALPTFGAVRLITTTEMMALYHAFKTTALGDADGVDEIAHGEEVCIDRFARLDLFREVAELLHLFVGGGAELLEMAEQRLGDAMFLLLVQAELDRVIAIALLRLHLKNTIGADMHNGHGSAHPTRIIDTSLTQLFS